MPFRRPLFLVVVLLIGALTAPAEAAPPPARVRFTAPPDGSLLVHGEYPPVQSSCVEPFQPLLHARYRGTIEVVRAADGSLSLVGELGFEDYLRGIAEVPRDWPYEALKAQVVAARTYALNRLGEGSGTALYDLCATTECQVYMGMEVEAGPWGDRWTGAVRDTAGEVLLAGGEPAITYYSSTSPGRTLDNEDVFGGVPLPYLRGVPEHDDEASPLARWHVEMPFDDLSRFLAAAGVWGGGRIDRVGAEDGSIAVRGSGRRIEVSKEGLRDALNETASCLAPDRYPTSEPDGYRLPQTVPSHWYRPSQAGDSIVLDGRGWGHGVGMVQWGAYGKAKRGLAYDDILAAYYGDLRPQAVQLPGTIRILIAEGITRLTVVPTGEATVDVDAPRPPWTVTGGRRLHLGHGPAPPPALEIISFRPRPASAEGTLRAPIELSDDATVRVELSDQGSPVGATETVPLEEGAARLEVPLPPVVPGRFLARAVAFNGVDEVTSDAVPIRIVEGVSAQPPESPPTEGARPTPRDEGASFPMVAVAAGSVLVLGLALGAVAMRRRGRHRP